MREVGSSPTCAWVEQSTLFPEVTSNLLAASSFRRLVRDPLLLIYQMPKVGSQTVEATLRECGLPHRVFRFHFLSKEYAKPLEDGLKAPENTELWKSNVREQLELREVLSRVLRARKWRSLFRPSRAKVHVITAVRDPIGLCLASTFENYFESIRQNGDAALDYCRYVLTSPETLPYVENWFDSELKRFVGLDVYQSRFPMKKGYAIYENRFARVLVYRFETLSALKQMLQDFLGCEVREVLGRNLSETKEYDECYSRAKEQLRFPKEFVSRTCQSKLMRHFYTARERRRFERRWTEDPPDHVPREFRVNAPGLAVPQAAT